MAYKIIWSPEAVFTFNNIVNYLTESFSDKEVTSFIQTVNRRLLILQQFPKISRPAGMHSRRRKAAIHKRTNLFYKISQKRKEVILPSFF
jgi:plasmid stabilization system protein ParE